MRRISKALLLLSTIFMLCPVRVSASETVIKDVKGADILFVGDSRAVGMSRTDNSRFSYIGKTGAGFLWFKDTAVDAIDEFRDRDMTLIINMGVNDLRDKRDYIDIINKNKGKWEEEGFTVCFASVNPVIDGKSNASDAGIQIFNKSLKKNLNDIWYMDSYGYLKKNGFDTVDGLHYTDSTYRKLADYYERYTDRVTS